MSSDTEGKPKLSYSATVELNTVRSLHDNTGQDVLMISEDKALLVLSRWKSRMERRWFWITPVSLSLSLFATLASATFNRPVLGIAPAALEGMFWVFAVLCGVWGAIEAVRAIKHWNVSAETIVDEMKRGGHAQYFNRVDGSATEASKPVIQ